MKITAIDAFPFRLPLRRDFRWASLQVSLGGFVFVEVRTDAGLVGWGEATALPDWGGDRGRHGGETQATVVSIIKTVIGPALVGLDPTAVGAAHAAMDKVLRGNTYARCAVDIALHDLWGKAVGQPVYKLLGGRMRPRVPVAHMIGIMPADEAIKEAAEAAADGIAAFQIKGGEDPERDLRTVRGIRDEVGPHVFLRLDANQGYVNAKPARRILADMEGVLDMVEQPVQGLDQMAALTRSIDIDVIADESCWTAADALELVQIEAADAISIYLAKAGGIAPARQVATIAAAAQRPCDVNGSIESAIGNAANLHFAISSPVVTVPAVIPVNAPERLHPCNVGGRYFEDDVVEEPFDYSEGGLDVSDRPGLGIEVNREKLERYREN